MNNFSVGAVNAMALYAYMYDEMYVSCTQTCTCAITIHVMDIFILFRKIHTVDMCTHPYIHINSLCMHECAHKHIHIHMCAHTHV